MTPPIPPYRGLGGVREVGGREDSLMIVLVIFRVKRVPKIICSLIVRIVLQS